MGSDRQDSDRQDFLERQEARRRRREQQKPQEASSVPLPRPAGTGRKATRRPSPDQAPISVSARSIPPTGAAQTPPPVRKKTSGGTKQPAAKRTTDSQQASRSLIPASPSADAGAQPLPGSLEGRRTTARREALAEATAPAREPKPSLLARTIVWATAALCGLLILASIGEAWTVHRLNQQIATSQQSVDQLQAQNQELQKLIQNLQQPGTIEKEARMLGFIFPGDQPVVIAITSSPPAPPATQAPPSSPGFWGFWPDWLKLFFGG